MDKSPIGTDPIVVSLGLELAWRVFLVLFLLAAASGIICYCLRTNWPAWCQKWRQVLQHLDMGRFFDAFWEALSTPAPEMTGYLSIHPHIFGGEEDFFVIGDKYYPASESAAREGCICDEKINRNGLGHIDDTGHVWFFVDPDCPYHPGAGCVQHGGGDAA